MLKQLAAATSGEAFLPQHTAEVTQVLQRIASDIRSGTVYFTVRDTRVVAPADVSVLAPTEGRRSRS